MMIKILKVISFLLLTGVVSISMAAEKPLTLKVITANESSLYVNLTLIMGEKDAVLIDVPFTFADAHRVVADILETGKNLKTVYVTHDHPDHFFGMQVIQDAFPGVEIISHPTVVADIWKSIPLKIKRWSPMLGNNGPAYPTAPKSWSKDYFELEGKRIEILGPMQGDHRHATAVWVPSIKALVTGDIVFQDIHVWLGEATTKQRLEWIKSLDELAELKPDIVVPGHQIPGRPLDESALEFTKNYIITFDKYARRAKTSEELIQMIRETYPNVKDVLNDFILPNSAKVAVGEMSPWQE